MIPELWLPPRASTTSTSNNGGDLDAAIGVVVAIPIGLTTWALVGLALKWLLA